MWYLDVESELLSVTSIKIKAQHCFIFCRNMKMLSKGINRVSSWNLCASYHCFPQYLQSDQEPMKALCLFLSTQSHYSAEQTSSNCVSPQTRFPLSTPSSTNGIKPAAGTPETNRPTGNELKSCTESQKTAFIWVLCTVIICGRKRAKGTREFTQQSICKPIRILSSKPAVAFTRQLIKRLERQVTKKTGRANKNRVGAAGQKPEVLLEGRGYCTYCSDQNISLQQCLRTQLQPAAPARADDLTDTMVIR